MAGRGPTTDACKLIQESGLKRFHFGSAWRESLHCFDGEQLLIYCVVVRHTRIKQMPVLRGGRPLHKPKAAENDVLAGNPRWGSLIFSAIGDDAFFAAGHKLKNNLFAAVQASPSMIFSGGKDQPVSSQNFVCAALGEDLITPIRIHFQGRSRATVRHSGDFNAHAIISSRKGGLGPRRRAGEDEGYRAHNENFS